MTTRTATTPPTDDAEALLAMVEAVAKAARGPGVSTTVKAAALDTVGHLVSRITTEAELAGVVNGG